MAGRPRYDFSSPKIISEVQNVMWIPKILCHAHVVYYNDILSTMGTPKPSFLGVIAHILGVYFTFIFPQVVGVLPGRWSFRWHLQHVMCIVVNLWVFPKVLGWKHDNKKCCETATWLSNHLPYIYKCQKQIGAKASICSTGCQPFQDVFCEWYVLTPPRLDMNLRLFNHLVEKNALKERPGNFHTSKTKTRFC